MTLESTIPDLSGGKPWTSDAPVRSTQVWLPPGMVNFGIGQPDFNMLPREIMRTAAEHRLSQENNYLLNYGSEKGDGYFRQAIAEFISDPYGMQVDPEQMVITAGASQALDLICTLFSKPGGTVFVEEPSYFLALRIFEDHNLHVVPIPMGDSGIDLEALSSAVSQERPDFMYVIPSYQNPTGVTMGEERRRKLAEIASNHNILLIADEVYHLLNFVEATPVALAAFADDAPILSLGSFSKILGPGLRLGWIQGSPELIEQIAGCGLLDSGGCANQFTAGLVRSVLELDLLAPYVKELKYTYHSRAQALSEALRKQIPEADFKEPSGGFFHWLSFPEAVATDDLLHHAQRHQVSYIPGTLFSSQNGLRNQLRLSYAFHTSAAQALGAHRLRQALDAYYKAS